MTSINNDLIEHYFQKRMGGMELKEIRLELEAKGFVANDVSDAMAAINDKELDSLQTGGSQSIGGIAKGIAALFILGGIGLWFWLQSKDFESYYQFLAFIPVGMGIGSYLLFRQNQQKMERRGS